METKFGMWLKSKGFARLFPVIVVAAMGYMGLRIATALQWGLGLHWYLPVFVLMALMFLLVVYAQGPGRGRSCSILSAYWICFLLYNVPALLVFDLAALLFRPALVVRAWLVLAAAGISALLLIYGSIHARQLKTVSYQVELGLPGGRARMVLLSDLHIGMFISAPYLERVARRVNALEPDLIVISGDIFDGYLPGDEALRPVAAAFRRMHAALGLYAVTGNHNPDISNQRFLRFLKDAGIHLLYNEVEELPEWNLAGRAGIVDMEAVRAPLEDILRNAASGKPTIVLDHDPQGIREAASCGVDLVLCGHTHKGQLFPLTILTRLVNGAQYFYGYGVSEKTRSVISAGTGFFGLPIRIGTDSEIVVVDLV